jgi:4'-phosphopantetheinyl transferase
VGRLAGQAREARLTEPLWHDGPLDALAAEARRPVVWSVRLDSEAAATALATAAHTDRDLADFAAAPDAGNRLLRRRLTRALLGRLTGVPAPDILFGRAADGASSVLSPKGWHVSVAGRAPYCLVGVGDVPVGVDVEPEDGAPPLLDMLTLAEMDMLARLPAELQAREWLRRWTAKEAHAKRLGYARRAEPTGISTRSVALDVLACRSAEGESRCYVREYEGRIETIALAP